MSVRVVTVTGLADVQAHDFATLAQANAFAQGFAARAGDCDSVFVQGDEGDLEDLGHWERDPGDDWMGKAMHEAAAKVRALLAEAP